MATNTITLEYLRKHLADSLSVKEGGAFHTSTKMDRAINYAQSELCLRLRCLEKFASVSLVSGTPSYALPDDWFATRYIKHIENTTYRLLSPMSEMRYQGQLSIASGTPEAYAIFDDLLYIYPTPGSSTPTLYHKYIAIPQILVNNEDVAFSGKMRLVPLHPHLIDLAAAILKAEENEEEKYIAVERYMKAVLPEIQKILFAEHLPVISYPERRYALDESTVDTMPRLNNYFPKP